MKQAFENVESLLNELSFILLEAGVPPRQIRMPEGRLPEHIPTERYAEAFDWLHRLSQSQEYADVLKAKTLRPQEIWDRYRDYGIIGLQEQVILQSAQLKLRKVWKTNRPSLFGRIYNDSEQDSDQQDSGSEQLRPAEAGTNEDHRRRRGRKRKLLPKSSDRGDRGGRPSDSN